MSSLSIPIAETSQASTSEASDSPQKVELFLTIFNPLLTLLIQMTMTAVNMKVPWNKERQSRTKANSVISKEYSDLTNWPMTIDDDFIQNCLM